MVTIKIRNADYPFALSLGFWRQIKQEYGVIPENFQQRLNDEYGELLPKVVMLGIRWGIAKLEVATPSGTNLVEPSLEDIEAVCDASVGDIIEQALIETMTKDQKRMHEKLVAKQNALLDELTGEAVKANEKLADAYGGATGE